MLLRDQVKYRWGRAGFELLSVTTVLCLFCCAISPGFAEENADSSSDDILLLDSMGRIVQVATNDSSTNLLPHGEDAKLQMAEPARGTVMPDEMVDRIEESQAGLQFFPAVSPKLMPYLASQDLFGNTAARPGAMFSFAPLEAPVQGAKSALSGHGLRYSLKQTATIVNMSDVMEGNNTIAYYTFDLQSAWTVYNAPASGTAGWIKSQVEAKTGLGSPGNDQSAKSNLGTVTDPTGIWSSVNGVRVPELAWGQSLFDGKFVAVAGMVSQGNYIDQNAYAQSGRSQFINSALINSLVLPLPDYNFGLNLQWQSVDEWYVMAGGSAGSAPAGYVPWTDFSWNDWSVVGELGYAPKDFHGLGPGVYRIQPFIAQAGGPTQGGLCFNLQQQLGAQSPFGWFGRFGFGGSDVSGGASAQIGSGFVWQGPFKHLLFQKTTNDRLGVGFVWSQPSDSSHHVYHENEYILETAYAMQLTPMIKLQPDVQAVWNPAHNPDAGPIVVFQLQLSMTW